MRVAQPGDDTRLERGHSSENRLDVLRVDESDAVVEIAIPHSLASLIATSYRFQISDISAADVGCSDSASGVIGPADHVDSRRTHHRSHEVTFVLQLVPELLGPIEEKIDIASDLSFHRGQDWR